MPVLLALYACPFGLLFWAPFGLMNDRMFDCGNQTGIELRTLLRSENRITLDAHLGNQFRNHMPVDVGESSLDPIVGHRQFFMVDSQQVQ